MRTTWRKLAVLVPIALVAGCAGVGGSDGGGNGSGGGGTASSSWSGTPSGALTTMGFGGEDEVGQSRVAAFKAAAPDVKVTINKGDFDAQQFLTAVASGNPPDLVYMSRALIGTYAAKGAIQPLDRVHHAASRSTPRSTGPRRCTSVTLPTRSTASPSSTSCRPTSSTPAALEQAGVAPEEIQTKDWDALASTTDKLFEQDGSKITRIGYDPKLPDSFPQWAMANGAADRRRRTAPPTSTTPRPSRPSSSPSTWSSSQGGWTKFKAFRDSYDIFGEKNPLTVHSIAAFPMENWYVNVLRDSIPAGPEAEVDPVHRPPGPADEPARRVGLGDPEGREEPGRGVRVGQDDDRRPTPG